MQAADFNKVRNLSVDCHVKSMHFEFDEHSLLDSIGLWVHTGIKPPWGIPMVFGTHGRGQKIRLVG